MDFKGDASDLALQDRLRVQCDTFLPPETLGKRLQLSAVVSPQGVYLSESEWGGRGRGGRVGEGIAR